MQHECFLQVIYIFISLRYSIVANVDSFICTIVNIYVHRFISLTTTELGRVIPPTPSNAPPQPASHVLMFFARLPSMKLIWLAPEPSALSRLACSSERSGRTNSNWCSKTLRSRSSAPLSAAMSCGGRTPPVVTQFNRIERDWTGLNGIGRDWTGLNGIERDWTGLNRIAIHFPCKCSWWHQDQEAQGLSSFFPGLY